MTYKDLPIVSETELIFARAQTRDWLHAVKKGGAGGGGRGGWILSLGSLFRAQRTWLVRGRGMPSRRTLQQRTTEL